MRHLAFLYDMHARPTAPRELYATFGSRTDKKKKDRAKVCLAVVCL